MINEQEVQVDIVHCFLGSLQQIVFIQTVEYIFSMIILKHSAIVPRNSKNLLVIQQGKEPVV